MMVMPSNMDDKIVHYFAGKYPGSVGLLFSPSSPMIDVPFYLEYALDNGCFSGFDEEKFIRMLDKSCWMKPPLWVTVPDVLYDNKRTLDFWYEYKGLVKRYGYNLGFVVQDGCTVEEVPEEAYCIFVGGTTSWKLENAHKFKGLRSWLHIGRVNTPKRLKWAYEIGADSVDGTGYFRFGKQEAHKRFTEFMIKQGEALWPARNHSVD
jgi:hypothetical protein